MDKEKKILKVCSIFFIIFGIFELIKLPISYGKGDFSLEKFTGIISSEIAQVVIIVIIAIFVIISLIELFLGVKGLKQAKGEKTGKSHIVIAKIFFVIIVIGLISSIMVVFQNKIEYMSLIKSITTTIIFYEYIKTANALIEK